MDMCDDAPASLAGMANSSPWDSGPLGNLRFSLRVRPNPQLKASQLHRSRFGVYPEPPTGSSDVVSFAGESCSLGDVHRLYRTPLQHLTVAMKLKTPPGMPYAQAKSQVLSTAHQALGVAMNQAMTRGSPTGSTGENDVLLRGTSQIHCLRGCIEVVMRLQYRGPHLDDDALSAVFAALERELQEQVVPIQPPAAAIVAVAGDGAATAAAAWERDQAAFTHQSVRAVPLLVYMHPPVFSTVASGAATTARAAAPGAAGVTDTGTEGCRGDGGRADEATGLDAGSPPALAMADCPPVSSAPVIGPETVRLDLFLDDPAELRSTAAGGGLRPGSAGGSADGCGAAEGQVAAGGVPPCGACVRVVVKQHGAVVAEVQRVHVGPAGASVSLDLSPLTEGGAALLVLPYRPEAAEEQEQQQRRGQEEPAVAALLCTTIAVVPPAVAGELCGLLRDMEQEATAAAPPATNPRVSRARAFTHHFLTLQADMVSLLLGCERLAAEAGALQEWAGAAQEGLVVAEAQERLTAELQLLGQGLLEFLKDMGLQYTLEFMLREMENAGIQLNYDTLFETEGSAAAPSQGFETPPPELLPVSAGDDRVARRGGESSEGNVSTRAGGGDYAEAVAHGASGGAGPSAGGVAEEVASLRQLRRRTRPANEAPPAGQRGGAIGREAPTRQAVALAAVPWGFGDAGMEARCTAFRCREAPPRDAAAAKRNALLATAAAALVVVAVGASGGGGLVLLPSWVLVEVALLYGSLVLPGLLLAARSSLGSPRLRDPCIRAMHLACLFALCLYVTWANPPGQALPAGRALASLMVVVQPASYSVHVSTSKRSWLLSAVALMVLFTAGRGSQAEGGADTSGSASFLWPLSAAGALVLLSVVLSAVMDFSWRMRFLALPDEHQEQA